MLKTRLSCEIGDLADYLVEKTGKPYNEIERALFDCGIWPQSRKTFLTTKFGPVLVSVKPGHEWLEAALQEIFKELQVDAIYVTEAI